jgi:hypothetical protein
MIKTDNLYSEVVINESPFYYDENGRLRARVLSEESIRGEKKEEVKMIPTPEKEKEPVMRTADFQDRDGSGTDDRDEKPEEVKKRIDAGGGKKIPTPPSKESDVITARPVMDGKKKVGMLMKGAKPGPGRNINTRAGLRGVDAALARGAELKKRGKEVLARTAELRSQLGVKRGEAGKAKLGAPMSPEQKAEKKGIKADIRALKDEKRSMKAAGEKPAPEMKRTLKDMRAKLKSMPKGAQRAIPQRGKMVGRGRLAMQESAPATDYLEEKMNLKTAKMGDVIKDFQESDAPQFEGKSKAKRRIMAIAAKLQAERG